MNKLVSISRLVLRLFVVMTSLVVLVRIPRLQTEGELRETISLIEVAIRSGLWVVWVWFTCGTVAALLVMMRIISATTAFKLMRGAIWGVTPMIVNFVAAQPEQTVNLPMERNLSHKGDDGSPERIVVGTIGGLGSIAFLESIRARRNKLVCTGALRGHEIYVPSNFEYSLNFETQEELIRPREEAPSSSDRTQDVDFIVRLMGPIEVQTRDGRSVEFMRSRSIELLTWIMEHREFARRSSARTAMWDISVRDATFSNVVSEVRRALGSEVNDPDEPWILRTYDDKLVLSSRVTSDVEILREAISEFEKNICAENEANLQLALEMVRGLPFSGATYLWPDTEGITTNIVVLIVDAAEMLAEVALANGDWGKVYWATGQGLRVVQGHEGLIALRMRALARSGSRAGVEAEWQAYLRALAVDGWSGGQPAAHIRDLYESLVQPNSANVP